MLAADLVFNDVFLMVIVRTIDKVVTTVCSTIFSQHSFFLSFIAMHNKSLSETTSRIILSRLLGYS